MKTSIDRTITRGLQELKSELSSEDSRIRQPGAGCNLILDTKKGLDDAFLEIAKNIQPAHLWTKPSNGQICHALKYLKTLWKNRMQ